MKTFFCCFFILCTMNSKGVFAKVEQSCDQVLIESTKLNSSEELVSYLTFLYEQKIISEEVLERFRQSFVTNKLFNPIEHKDTSFGPVFSSSFNRAHYTQMQYYLDLQIQNNHFLDLNYIDESIQKMVIGSKHKQEKKMDTSFFSQFEFIMTEMLESDDFDLHIDLNPILSLMVKNAPKTSEKIGDLLFESSKNGGKIIAAMAAVNPNLGAKYLEKLLAGDLKQAYFIPGLLYDDRSERFAKFVIEALSSNIAATIKLGVMEKIDFMESENLEKKMIDMLKDNNWHLGIMAVKKLAMNKSKKMTDFFIEITKKTDEYSSYVRGQAAQELAIRGAATDLVKKSFLGHLFLDDSQKKNEENLLLNIFSEIKGRSDAESLELIKLGLRSPYKRAAELAALALKGRKDPESLEVIRNLTGLIPTTKQIFQKLSLLEGREGPAWIMDFIYEGLKSKDSAVRHAAMEALRGRSTLETRNFIEEQYFLSSDQLDKEGYKLALIGRPMEDLAYFVEKYANTKDVSLAVAALTTARNREDFKFAELVKEMFLRDGFKFVLSSQKREVVDYAFAYIESIPAGPHQQFWYEVASRHHEVRINARAISRLGQFADNDEYFEIFKKGADSFSRKVSRASMAPYLYRYIVLMEKASSGDQQAKNDLSLFDTGPILHRAW